MLLPCQFLILLVAVPIIVNSSPHGIGSPHSHQQPGKAEAQDTVFPGDDYGVGGDTASPGESSAISSRIGPGNSNSDSKTSSDVNDSASNLDEENKSDNNSEGSGSVIISITENNPESVSIPISTTVQDNKPTQRPTTVSNGTKPVRQDGCTVRPNPGECRGAFPRYYFNEANDQCDCFLFGGCDEEGVTYTWLTLTECHEACVPTNTEKGPGCQRVTLDEVTRFLDESNKDKKKDKKEDKKEDTSSDVAANISNPVKEDNSEAEDTNDTKDTSVVEDTNLTQKPVNASINEIAGKALNSNIPPP